MSSEHRVGNSRQPFIIITNVGTKGPGNCDDRHILKRQFYFILNEISVCFKINIVTPKLQALSICNKSQKFNNE